MQERDIEKLINKRISTRGFLDKPVSQADLEKLMQLATRAPSWKNAQSYKLVFLTGDKKDQLLAEFKTEIEKRTEPRPHYDYETSHPSSIKKRMFKLGMDLYSHMGIDRKDKEGREAHFMRNYEAFGAPVVGFFYIPQALGAWTLMDLGILIGYLSLVAEGMGMATCFQASLAVYPDIVDRYTNMEGEGMKMIVGMSLGYADPNDQNNSFYSSRVPLEDVMQVL